MFVACHIWRKEEKGTRARKGARASFLSSGSFAEEKGREEKKERGTPACPRLQSLVHGVTGGGEKKEKKKKKSEQISRPVRRGGEEEMR